MQKKIEAYIREHHMIEEGSRVIAAVSGGADSVCMLHLLTSLRGKLKFELRAVHVHHGLRGAEADRDARYVRELSNRWEVPCLVIYEDVASYGRDRGMSLEEAGREVRYGALYREAGRWEGSVIAVAHHQEDQAETILHNLFRGSGLKGLGGMAPVRGAVIRPLLCVSRQEILGYLKDRDIVCCEDSTNASCDYTRNRLRHMVIPVVCREINPEAVEHIAAAGERMRQADRYFCREAQKLWKVQGQKTGEECRFPAGALVSLPEILRGYVVLEMIEALTGSRKDITAVHVDRIVGLAGKGVGRRVSLPYGMRAWRDYECVCVSLQGQEPVLEPAKEPSLASRFAFERLPGSILGEKTGKIPEKKYTKWFDYDRIKDTLSIRCRQPGDFLILPGGGRKRLNRFLIDEKILREQRDRIPVLTEGNQVLWVVGYRISEYYKIREATHTILQVDFYGGKAYGR